MHEDTPRQLVHLSGLVFVYIAQFLTKAESIIVFFSIAAFFFLYAEYVTRSKPVFGFRKLVYLFEKRNSSRPFVGAFWFYVGVGIAFALFPLNIASASAAILAVGDSFSTIFGLNFGKHKINGKKSLEGSTGFLIGSFLISLFFVNPVLGFVGAFVGTIVELLTPHKVGGKKTCWFYDDNLLIPVISGGVMFALFILGKVTL